MNKDQKINKVLELEKAGFQTMDQDRWIKKIGSEWFACAFIQEEENLHLFYGETKKAAVHWIKGE